MLEKISSPEHTLEQLHSGELLYLPDLTDPNVQGITPGLINTHLFFAEFTPPEQVVNSFVRLKERLFLNPLLKPAEVLLQSALYQDYLKLTIFLTTGKTASFNDIAPHLKLLKQMDLPPEDKLVTFPAAIIGFAVTNRGGGKNGINHTDNYEAFLKQLTTGKICGVFSPLCAQYDAQVQPSGSIINYRVAENLAEAHVARTIDWIKMLTFISKLRNPEFVTLWSTLTGDADHINSIVPRVISYHAQRQEIVKMFLKIDRHFNELQSLTERLQSGITVTNLTEIENFVAKTLEKFFGKSWQNLSEADLHRQITDLDRKPPLASEDKIKLQLLYITRDLAYPTIRRFINENRNVRESLINLQSLDDDLAALTPEEWQEWLNYKGQDIKEFLEQIKQKTIRQGNVTAVANALHEVILYHCLGAYAAQNNFAVIGLDIDHDPYMTLAWESGWQERRAPLVYARNPDTGKADPKYAHRSYAELYASRYRENSAGVQPIGTMALREPWFNFV